MNPKKNNKTLSSAVLLAHLFFATIFMLQAQELLPPEAPPPTIVVGAIPGEIDVSPMGAATYTIPIEVVPGTQGMQPNLSIVYNSFSGMGILGMKWNLAGLSAITRCGKIPYYDGDMTVVDFIEDRFALDGNQLRKYSSGYYGDPGVLLATEAENFIRVMPYDGTFNKPNYFKAYTDDGTIIEYGNSPDSKQTIVSDSILSWHVSKITDANGNYMTFHYGGASTREIYINEIRYTGNSNSGMQTYAKVVFNYTNIPTNIGKNIAFVSGYSIPQTQLLKFVTVYYNNIPVRKYQFNYMHETAQNEKSVHLKEIVLSAYDEYGSVQQLNPTTMNWGAQNSSFVTKTFSGFHNGYMVTGDFNGDGFTDIVTYDENHLYVYTNFQNLTFSSPDPLNWLVHDAYAYDLDMDGKDELIIGEKILDDKNNETGKWKFYCLHFHPYEWCELGTFEIGKKEDPKVYFGRFHSSGAPNILFACIKNEKDAGGNYHLKYKLYDLDGTEKLSLKYNDDISFHVTDINGNGKDEILIIDTDTAFTYEYHFNSITSKDDLNLIHRTGFPTRWHKVYYGDYNGDGISDLVTFYDGTWELWLGLGNGYYTWPGHALTCLDGTKNGSKPKYPVIIADMNGDGKDEIIQLIEENATPKFAICNLYNFLANGSCSVSVTKIELPDILDIKKLDRNYFRIGDFNGDGKADIVARLDREGALLMVYANGDNQYEFTTQITDGIGKTVKLSYRPQYFCAENRFAWDERPFYRTTYRKYFLPVVDTLQVSNGIGNELNKCTFLYKDPAYSLSRKTFLGFREVLSTSYFPVFKRDTKLFGFPDNANAKQILVPTQQESQISDFTSSKNFYTYNIVDLGNKRFVLNCSKNEQRDLLLNTKTIATTELNNQGRVVKTINRTYSSSNASVNDWVHSDTNIYFYKGISLSSNNSYHKKTVLEKTLATQQYKNNGPPLTDTTTYDYYMDATNKGRLKWERQGNSDGSITTSYNNYLVPGICKEKTVSATGLLRKTTCNYDATGRFTESINNVLNHETKITYDSRTGNKTKEIDPNGLITTYKYDALGNLILTTYPDGTTTTTSVGWYTSSFISNAKYYVFTQTPAQPDVKVYYDVLGREVCRYEDGQYYETQYNNRGEVIRTSYPFGALNDNRIWRTYTYDNYGRKLTETAPYDSLSCSYSTRKVTVTDHLRHTSSSKDYDALGRMITASDKGGDISYAYTVTNGKLHQTTISVSGGGTTTILTDQWDNRLSINDPNAGTITSTYTKLNELKTQKDANGNVTTYQYDTIGRVKQKQFTAPDNTTQIIDYSYDSATKGKGKLYQIKVDGVVTETFSYDTYSRLYQHTKKIDNTSYTQTHTYDKNGQLRTLTYPDGFSIKYSYLSNGKLKEIRRNNADTTLIYKVNTRNKYNQITGCEYGTEVKTYRTYNSFGLLTRIQTGKKVIIELPDEEPEEPYKSIPIGSETVKYTVDSSILNYRYAYDTKGLMISRSESVMNRLETYQYDTLDRLRTVTAGMIGQTGTTQTFTYYDNGNIKNNSKVGEYSYGGSRFPAIPPKPHAVIKIEPINNSVISANQCDVSYNYFNQPTKITENTSATLGYRLDLFYNANQQRNKAVRYINKNNNYVLENTRYYVNKRYEKEIDETNGTRHYHYIYGDDGVVALHIAFPSTDSMYYIHTDHLGSYCAITNTAKQTVQHNYFDPWGNTILLFRGLPPDPPQEAPSLNFTLTSRGFTGHEHYPYFKIINMNGRLYDPVIGRFFSPDKYVMNSSFTQDFNRYTYARNNPLKYTDPTGDFWWIPLVAIGVSAVVAATSYTISVAASPGGFQNWSWDNFGFSMMMGVGQGLITSGIGGAFGAVGSLGVLGEIGRAGAHAIVGGMFSEATGGNFWTGAATSFASSLVGSATAGLPWYAQIGTSTITGGVTSKLTGGTFWQGAVNGFMVSALNHAMHDIPEEIAKRKGYLKEQNDRGNLSENVKKGTFMTSLGTNMVKGSADLSVKEIANIASEAEMSEMLGKISTKAKIIGRIGVAASIGFDAYNVYDNPSAENWAKLGVNLFIQGSNLLNLAVPGLGTGVSIGLEIIEANGGFDWFYNKFK